MFHRLVNPSESSSFFLFGPRGTGKSFLLYERFKNSGALYINLLKPSLVLEYQRDPSRLKRIVENSTPSTEWIIIDEVQKVPELLDVVHDLIETTDKKFALTGSSARKLKRGAANLLAGRAFVYKLFPLTFFELNNTASLLDLLSWGTLPKIFSFTNESDKKKYLRAYCGTYLKEEIKEEQIVRSVDPFINFLEVATQCDGTIINYTKIGRDVGVDTKTVQSFYQILEDTLLGFKLDPFHESFRKRQNKNPKFYFFDSGVSRALARTINLPLQLGSYEYGNRFEQLFISNCLALNHYFEKDFRFSYLRTKDDFEIDLVIERPGLSRIFLEIKSTVSIQIADFAALESFAKDFPHETYIVASCDPTPNQRGPILFKHYLEVLKEIFMGD